MSDDKEKVTCVVRFYGNVTSRYTERKTVHEENGRRYVMHYGLRYHLDPFNEYELAYGEKSSHSYSE